MYTIINCTLAARFYTEPHKQNNITNQKSKSQIQIILYINIYNNHIIKYLEHTNSMYTIINCILAAQFHTTQYRLTTHCISQDKRQTILHSLIQLSGPTVVEWRRRILLF